AALTISSAGRGSTSSGEAGALGTGPRTDPGTPLGGALESATAGSSGGGGGGSPGSTATDSTSMSSPSIPEERRGGAAGVLSPGSAASGAEVEVGGAAAGDAGGEVEPGLRGAAGGACGRRTGAAPRLTMRRPSSSATRS